MSAAQGPRCTGHAGPRRANLPGDVLTTAAGGFARARPWDKFALSLDEIHEGENDTVFALGHTDVSKDRKDARLPVVHVWRFEGGWCEDRWTTRSPRDTWM